MACFPRFVLRKQKNSFTPAEDQNIDTLLNDTNDNAVQIGRYVRREESSLFTVNHAERIKQRQLHLRESIANYNQLNNHKHNKNVNSKINQTTTTTIDNYHKAGLKNTNESLEKYEQLPVNGSIVQSKKHSSGHSIKLEVIKEQTRPTIVALAVSSTEEDNKGICKDKRKARPKFFIGSNKEEEGEEEKEVKVKNISTESVKHERLPSYIYEFPCNYINLNYNKPNVNAAAKASCVSLTTYETNFNNCRLHCNKLCPVNGFNKLGKFTRTSNTQQDFPTSQCTEVIHIPPPPPLPPQCLLQVKSCTLLSKLKTEKEKSRTSVKQCLQNINRSSSYDPAISTMENLFNTILEPLEQASKQNETESYNNNNNSSNNSTNPLYTSSPKSQRAEGGLIYARSNVPIKKAIHIEFIKKDEKTRNLILEAIEKNDFLNNYLDNERKEMVIDAMELEYFEKNSFIINENDEGSEIYVSVEGQFDVIKQGIIIGCFGAATVFGELAILYNAKRFASIRAASEATVWKIDRDKFRKIMVISGSREREENLNFLRSAPFLNDLSEEVLHKVVDLLQRKFFSSHTCIIREGDIGNEFFIIRGGTVTIKKRLEHGAERIVDRRKRGDYFGEQALLNADCRQASVYADPPGTEVLQLHREAFISYLGTIPQLRELPVEKLDQKCRDSQHKPEFDNEYSYIELVDLKKIATLGAGAFGKVDLVTYGETAFALKIIKKIDVVKQDQIEHVYNEKHVMIKCRGSPFIIELYKTFRDDKFVYFLMEACMGGDVWTIMSQKRFFDEKSARFIAGCVVEAFDFLHSHGIIYRDLKPENLMLTTDGYCKLVDFGFAKQLPAAQKTHTFAGTPEYVAPEIILDRGHDRSADYWALGILVFELLVGKTPFRGQNQIKIYQQILGGIDVVQMPSKVPKMAQALIKALCKQLPAERLGYQRKGIMDIKKHSWFDGFEWHKLKSKQLISPIKRPLSSKTDLRYFGSLDFMAPDQDSPAETSGWDVDF